MNRVFIYTFLLIASSILLFSCKSSNVSNDTTALDISELIQPNTTTLICIRHAEKMADRRNPFLTKAGKERAQDFAALLEDVNVDAIYSSEYNRTLETVMPLSQKKSIPTKIYDPRDFKPLMSKLLTIHKNQTVVIVGHSNSTPQFVNMLIGEDAYSEFDERDYDNLFLVSLKNQGDAEVQLLQYGVKTIVE